MYLDLLTDGGLIDFKYVYLMCVQMWIEFGRIKFPQGFHPNDLEEKWGKLILEMLQREKALRPAVERWMHAHAGYILGLM